MAKTQSSPIERAFIDGMGAGFDIAIKTLFEVHNDENNGNVTNCIHAYEWATYLDRMKETALNNFISSDNYKLKKSPVE